MAYGTSEQDAEVNVDRPGSSRHCRPDRANQKVAEIYPLLVNAGPSGKAIRLYRALLRIG
jgi:hypothetical protein